MRSSSFDLSPPHENCAKSVADTPSLRLSLQDGSEIVVEVSSSVVSVALSWFDSSPYNHPISANTRTKIKTPRHPKLPTLRQMFSGESIADLGFEFGDDS